MFERRLKIFLAFLLVFVFVLLARAMQLQVVQRDYWRDQASKSMRDERLLPTSRGRILDRNGKVLAIDEPCLDACVDYRIIASDPDYIKQLGLAAVRSTELAQYKAATADGKKKLLQDQIDAINARLHKMWVNLALLSGQGEDQIEETRQAIVASVQFRRREIWHRKLIHEDDDKAARETKNPWYRKWLMSDEDDSTQTDAADFKIEDETISHVILEDIDKDTQNELSRHSDDYPGLEVKPAMHRKYPYGMVACHLIGHLSKVRADEVDPVALDGSDELTRYRAADQIGRDGLEALGEPTLRGALGCDVIDGENGKTLSTIAPKPGGDLKCTIDIDLEQQVQAMFDHVHVPWDLADVEHHFDDVAMHGAAVVIDVATNDVLVMASAPGFDPNHFDEEFHGMATDNLNKPLLNRATQDQFQPGSTVKPMVGLGAITQGLLGVNEGIECTGYLVIGGKKYLNYGRCWTVATCKTVGMDPAHHPIPYPHEGHDGNPPGFLTYADALERSCNVFFETTADRLKIPGLDHWFGVFGLGRPTGIGIAEARGNLPEDTHGPNWQFNNWTSGIGQGLVLATPIQMANVAATIARRGIWMKPKLVSGNAKISPYHPRIAPSTQKSPATQSAEKAPDDWSDIPDQVDLHLSPAGIDAAFTGMINVVNSRSGTGQQARRSDMIVAGKTGTAQGAALSLPVQDAKGDVVYEPDGKPKMAFLIPATHDHPQPEHAWYRFIDEEGKMHDHAWFIGFAPADHPKYAICVMVEYAGGGGGPVSGIIAKQILDALIKHGYLAGSETQHSVSLAQ